MIGLAAKNFDCKTQGGTPAPVFQLQQKQAALQWEVYCLLTKKSLYVQRKRQTSSCSHYAIRLVISIIASCLWSSYSNLSRILSRCNCIPEVKFLDQNVCKVESEQKHRQAPHWHDWKLFLLAWAGGKQGMLESPTVRHGKNSTVQALPCEETKETYPHNNGEKKELVKGS